METGNTIAIVGIGGAGLNTINRLSNKVNARLIAIDFDSEQIEKTIADECILLEDNSVSNEEIIKKCLGGNNAVILFAGLGGKTSSKILPRIVSLAKQNNNFIVVVTSKPFSFEGYERTRIANEIQVKIQDQADYQLIVENDNLLKVMPYKTSINDAFEKVDEIILNIHDCIKKMNSTNGSCCDLLNALDKIQT